MSEVLKEELHYFELPNVCCCIKLSLLVTKRDKLLMLNLPVYLLGVVLCTCVLSLTRGLDCHCLEDIRCNRDVHVYGTFVNVDVT